MSLKDARIGFVGGGAIAEALLGGLAVLLGAYSLVMDFEGIELGVKRGVHKKYGWSAARSLLMS